MHRSNPQYFGLHPPQNERVIKMFADTKMSLSTFCIEIENIEYHINS